MSGHRLIRFLPGLLVLMAHGATAQVEEAPIKVFGYFQAGFQHQANRKLVGDRNSFSVQQLNLLFQKDLAKNWTSFINFEILNNFSFTNQWGSLNLEEAWIRYRASSRFNIKMGLQIPEFNNLNQIKNRTPLLPYIIRPLVYETSFNEFLEISEFIPERAFLQVYGYIPMNKFKFDYAVYVGNSPNIETRLDGGGNSGNDSTDAVLVGGRLGFRYVDLKVGASATYERSNVLQAASESLLVPVAKLTERPRIRYGFDLSFTVEKMVFEGEFISVRYDENVDPLDVDRDFYYVTVGYDASEELFVYAAYYQTHERVKFGRYTTVVELGTPGFGISYSFTDRIKLKLQYANVRIKAGQDNFISERWHFLATAISVFF